LPRQEPTLQHQRQSMMCRIKKWRIVDKKDLTSALQTMIAGFRDWSGVASSSSSAQGLFMLLRAVKSSISGTALDCGSALACSLVCERSGSCYRRAVFIGDDLAAKGSPCSSPSHREGAILGPVRRGLLSGTLESIDQHQYCGYATRSKSFLFRPCFSAQWTALNTGWTHRHLGGAAQRLHV
jgi:hypothetical protein